MELHSFKNSISARFDDSVDLTLRARSVNNYICFIGHGDTAVASGPSDDAANCKPSSPIGGGTALGGGIRARENNLVNFYDLNGDGFLKMDEFRSVLHDKLGKCCSDRCPHEAHNSWWKQWDCDGLVQDVFPNSTEPDMFGRYVTTLL